jgi:hypothetical protein
MVYPSSGGSLQLVKINYSAIVDPAIDDDITISYSVGSLWFNTVSDECFVCLDATDGAAVWKQVTNNAGVIAIEKEAPLEHFLGQSLLHYPESGNVTVSEIQYTRIWLTAGLVLDRMRYYIDSGANPARYVCMGLYDQADPFDDAQFPRNRVAQTNSMAPGGNDTFITLSLTSSYIVTITGYYWIAFIVDSKSLLFAMTAVHRSGFLPVQRAAGSGTTLPSSAGSSFTNPVSSVVYAATLEVV